MLNEEALYRLSERLVKRAEDLNMYMLKKLARQIRELGELTPSQLREVFQSVKYGNDINEIITKIAQFNKMNEKDIYDIFENVAKKNQNYAEQFYKYRNIGYIPYNENKALKSLVRGLAEQTNSLFMNISKTSAFGLLQPNGNILYTPLSEIYQKVTDEAILSILEGRETFQTNYKRTMKILSKGIEVVDFSSGYHRRLDSQVRMNILDGLRQTQDKISKQFAEEYYYDAILVEHHKNPAPDHSTNMIGGYDVDGTMFVNIPKIMELQKQGIDTDIEINGNEVKFKGKIYKDFDSIDMTLNRHVGTLNCYHSKYYGVLGAIKSVYSESEIQKDKEDNERGFEFEGKHYTNYQGTQLQRRIETEIRKAKERREFYKEAGSDEYFYYENKINKLRNKYNNLSRVSGLPTHINRLQIK